LTIGVLNRIYELSDRETPGRSKDFFSLIPLAEVLSELFSCGPATKKVTSVYEKLLSALGPELEILLNVPISDIHAEAGPLLAEAVDRMRRNQVIRDEGYDGEYGTIHLFESAEKQAVAGQMALFARQTPERTERPAPPPKIDGPQKPKSNTTPRPASAKDPILDPLNPEQKAAVLHQGGNVLVVAGPGTGKTMTLTHRIAWLIRTGAAEPEQVLALTFTRKAAREMEQRISVLLKGLHPTRIPVSTLHRFCLRILRNEGGRTDLPRDFTLCSELDTVNIAKDILKDQACFSGAKPRVRRPSAAGFLKAIPAIKKALVLDSGKTSSNDDIFPFFEEYQRTLRDLGMLDLDDLEVEALRLLRNHPEVSKAYGDRYPRVFVDEYQDTNSIQVEILKTLVQPGKATIFAIGDPDQAIYGFRGAEVKNFHCFTRDFHGAMEVALTRNYRSTEVILKGSAVLMGKEKPLECESSGGDPVSIAPCRTESEEAEMVVEQVERLIGGTTYFSLDSGRVASHEGTDHLGFGDIGVLFRVNAQGDALEKALHRAGIPFMRSGETPLVSQYPINILWRFFQTLKYPDNPYYLKVYEELTEKYGVKARGSARAFDGPGSVSDLIDQAVEFHDFDCPSDESTGACTAWARWQGILKGAWHPFWTPFLSKGESTIWPFSGTAWP